MIKAVDHVWPFARDHEQPMLPPPLIADLRNDGDPVSVPLYDGQRAVLLTKYDDVVTTLKHANTSSNGRAEGFPYISDSARANRGSRQTFDRLDPPVHDEQRGMLTPSFTPKRIGALRPAVEETVDALLDSLEPRGSAELLTEFAELVPARVVTKLMGLPYEDSDFFLDRVHRWMNDKNDVADIAQAMTDVKDYFSDVVDQRIASGGAGDDLISLLVREQLLPGRIDRDQLIITLHLLLTAGFETTANAIALGTLALLENKDAWDELAATEDEALVRGAVEEILRFVSPAHQVALRIAAGPIPIGHHVIQPGQGIIATVMGANHDPAKFEQPDRLYIHRSNARDHLAFGTGIHQCLGQNLARLELQVVFAKLPRRIPGMQLSTPITDLTFRSHSIAYTAPVPVHW